MGSLQVGFNLKYVSYTLTLFSSNHQDRGKVQNISKEFQHAYSEISHKEQRNYAALTEGPIKRFSLGSLQWVSDTLGPPSQANGNHSVIAPLWILLVTR